MRGTIFMDTNFIVNAIKNVLFDGRYLAILCFVKLKYIFLIY